MRNGVFYLNNNGSRWVVLESGKKQKITFFTKSGNTIIRTPNYYFSFGNFGGVNINYKGKKINCLIDTLLED